MALATSLARRVQQLRDFRNMTVRDLGKYSRLGLQRIEDIEAGIETWLSATERQLLAKGLAVEPMLLQEVEIRPYGSDEHLQEAQPRLAEAILSGRRELQCPQCGGSLRCSVQDALDLDGLPTRFAKAYCLKCPFVLRA